MRKDNNKKEIVDYELIIKYKLKIIANIIDSLREILVLLNPFISKFLLMEEAKMYQKNGTFKRVEDLFDNISTQSRKLINSSIFYDILKDLKN
ncbi:MAG: hypothetical protein ACFFCV_16160 [Promethearchaeota archaeon]